MLAERPVGFCLGWSVFLLRAGIGDNGCCLVTPGIRFSVSRLRRSYSRAFGQ